ncbi:MAG: UDP-N-acetylmuramoyl-L-alanine--D-glutamate ligase [Patescibacteria group bacterium]|jgi:UDP-N-acetylmuramoylalanine--D-glutamate ligase
MDLSSISNFKDAIVTVMGLGRYKQGSGLGTAKWLMRHEAQTVITDLKDEKELKESVDLVMEWFNKYKEMYQTKTIYQPLFVLGEHRKEDFTGVDCVVQNPGVPSESEFVQQAKSQNIHIESDVSLFMRYYPHEIIAVTGTKGKTTTTLLLGAMVKTLDPETIIAGNIKVSPLEFLDDLLSSQKSTPVVLELSSWLLESLPGALSEMKKGPTIAVLTNVFPDHLNRYATYEDYQKSKEIIFEYQTPDQYTVLNRDHDLVRAMEPRVKGKLFWFSKTDDGKSNGCFVKDGTIIFRKDGVETLVLPYAEVALQGEHNLENVLSAVCASMLRGVPVAGIQKVLKEFKGVDDRQELVREVDEIMYINDTAATMPTAVVAALKVYGKDKRAILIAGGVNKNLSFDEMIAEAIKGCKAVILFPGDASDIIEKGLTGKVPVDHAGSMKEAVQKARKLGENGDIVLLSPGAASFNMFKNEFDRGEQFREEVRNL